MGLALVFKLLMRNLKGPINPVLKTHMYDEEKVMRKLKNNT